MKDEVKLCDVCWRAVDTVILGRDILPGGVEVPMPHKDRDGNDCDGTSGEVITGWGLRS